MPFILAIRGLIQQGLGGFRSAGKQGMVVHTFNSSTWKVGPGGSEFKASLAYKASSRLARTGKSNFVGKKKKPNNQ